MKFIGIIPARYASTRFPGKPLALIKGKSMIQRVYEQASLCKTLSGLVVATDDERILSHVGEFGEGVITSATHASGTDRCFEAATILNKKYQLHPNDVIINIQGDEPFIMPEQIDQLCRCFESIRVHMATLIKKIENINEIIDSNIVKVVISNLGYALYFSRAPIPFARGLEVNDWLGHSTYYRHIGLYAYRYATLDKITKLPISSLEQSESLEQLRWIENGYKIYTVQTKYNSVGIDTPEDLDKAERIIC